MKILTGKRKENVGGCERRGMNTKVQVPVNIERVLLRANEDRSFMNALLNDRLKTIEESGMQLTDSEKAMFESMPASTIQNLVSHLKPSTQKNRRFIRNVAAAAVVGGMAVAGYSCSMSNSAGVDPGDETDEGTDGGPDSGTGADGDADGDSDTENLGGDF